MRPCIIAQKYSHVVRAYIFARFLIMTCE